MATKTPSLLGDGPAAPSLSLSSGTSAFGAPISTSTFGAPSGTSAFGGAPSGTSTFGAPSSTSALGGAPSGTSAFGAPSSTSAPSFGFGAMSTTSSTMFGGATAKPSETESMFLSYVVRKPQNFRLNRYFLFIYTLFV